MNEVYFRDPQTDQVNQAGEVIRHFQSPYPSFIIPLVQAVITGFLVGLVMFTVALVFHWSRPWLYWLVTWFVVQCLAWLLLLAGWRSVIYRLETMLNIDLSGDQVIGEPPRQTVRVQLERDQGKTVQFLDVEIDPDQLVRVARSVLAGGSFSEGSLTGYAAPLTRSQFRTLRDQFLTRHWLVWKNEDSRNQGLEFTKAGLAVMRSLVNHPTMTER